MTSSATRTSTPAPDTSRREGPSPPGSSQRLPSDGTVRRLRTVFCCPYFTCRSGRESTAPLGESCSTGLPEDVAVLVAAMHPQVALDSNGCLQPLHAPNLQHRPLSSSDREVWTLCPVNEPASHLAATTAAQVLQGLTVEPQSIRRGGFGPAILVHRIPEGIEGRFTITRPDDNAAKSRHAVQEPSGQKSTILVFPHDTFNSCCSNDWRVGWSDFRSVTSPERQVPMCSS
jgi:hypothetical protein